MTARFDATVYGQWCMGYVGRGAEDPTSFAVRAHPDCLDKATQDLSPQIDPNSVNVLDQLRVLYRYGDTGGAALDDGTLKFPDIRFDYSSWTVAGLAGRDIVYEAPNMAFAGDIPPQNFELADLNMDALVDIVRTSDSGADVLLGEGEFSATHSRTSMPLILARTTESGLQRQVVPRLADDRFHFADIFGDSFVDLVEVEDGLIHIYRRQGRRQLPLSRAKRGAARHLAHHLHKRQRPLPGPEHGRPVRPDHHAAECRWPDRMADLPEPDPPPAGRRPSGEFRRADQTRSPSRARTARS